MALGASGSAAVLVPPQYGAGEQHAHAKAGGGSHSHSHPDAAPGHQHAADSEHGLDGVALLPLPGSNAKGFMLDWQIKEAHMLESGTLLLKGHGNTWALDRDGETTARGAFDEGLADFLHAPALLADHNRDRLIGRVTKAIPDETGLYVEAEVPKPVAQSEPWHHKVYNDIRVGIKRTFSMGGVFLKAASDPSRIVKVRLYEISVVNVPANPTSIFEVAEAKGLHFEDAKAAVAMPGVGRGHGRHRSGGAHHTHRNGRSHRHRLGTKPHVHGHHTHRPRHGGASVTHRHRGAVKGHSHAVLTPFHMDLDEWEIKAADAVSPLEDDGVDALDDRDMPALIDGLAAALDAVIGSDADPETMRENIDSLLDEFADAAADVLSDDDAEPEIPADENTGKWVTALIQTKQSSPSGLHITRTLASLRAKETTVPDTDTTARDDGSGTKSLSPEDAKGLMQRLDTLETEKKERELEQKAAAEATKRLEQEAKEAEEQKAADAAEQKRFDEMVAKTVERQRASVNTGTKMRLAPSTGPMGDGQKSHLGVWLKDLKAARSGDYDAYQRIQTGHTEAIEAYGLKAMGESAGLPAGGALVPPQYWQAGLAEFRIAASKLRPYVTVITDVNSNQVLIPRETGIATVAWVAENAVKPSTDQVFGQITVNILALAGISKVSNQLLADSSPAVDQLVRKDLGRLIGQAEDVAMLDGTGTGQPTGILRTTGVLTVSYASITSTTGKIADLLSALITAVQTNYFGDPTLIVAHPREVSLIRQEKDANGRYIFEAGYVSGNSPTQGGAGSFLGVDQALPGAAGSVWGLPVIADANMPTNYSGTTPGGGTESPIIVGRFDEAYLFERAGMSIDVSNEAGTSFESNQTWFRGEERVGFTAARQPTAFAYGTGLTATAV